ncbi:hypothetical protein PUN28_008207 [Cardiocondyla obscurior]|uniref:Uncharacterized protein n=1 Tax=Cardiocondyla obscurior TaxID=286306 RepID=A0AAW2FYQ4_9HYME
MGKDSFNIEEDANFKPIDLNFVKDTLLELENLEIANNFINDEESVADDRVADDGAVDDQAVDNENGVVNDSSSTSPIVIMPVEIEDKQFSEEELHISPGNIYCVKFNFLSDGLFHVHSRCFAEVPDKYVAVHFDDHRRMSSLTPLLWGFVLSRTSD